MNRDDFPNGPSHETDRDPLDGSVTGTIGGGGPESGGPVSRPAPPDMPPVKPEHAASGRRAPDAIGATVEPDSLGSGPSDVNLEGE
jgi:hypothetical protein